MKVKYIGNVATLLLKPKEIYNVFEENERSYTIKVDEKIGRYSKKMFEVAEEN